jgi:hypothetical protein
MPELNIPDPDPRDLDGTQPGKPIKIPAPIPNDKPALPPRPPRNAQRAAKRDMREKRKNDRQPAARRDPQRSGLYLPAWSLGLMLLLVIGISFTIVLLVLGLGGRALPGGEPVVVIITAFPSSTPPLPQFAPTLPAATLPGINPSVPQFPLEGPTLAPVVLSATPFTIQAGTQVQIDPSNDFVNVRPEPSTDNTILFTAEPDDLFVVVEGPAQGSGFTWWRVQDINNADRIGWIAAELIRAVVPSS